MFGIYRLQSKSMFADFFMQTYIDILHMKRHSFFELSSIKSSLRYYTYKYHNLNLG
jgi:hypothetical protein